MRTRFLGFLVFAPLLCLPAGGELGAQNPEKFERVVPAKPQPGRPTAAKSIEELKRKAEAVQVGGDICARVDWPKFPSLGHAMTKHGPSAGTIAYRETKLDSQEVEYCAVAAISAESVDGGARIRSFKRWQCAMGNYVCSVSEGRVCWFHPLKTWWYIDPGTNIIPSGCRS